MFKRILPLLVLAGCAAAPGDRTPPPDWVVGTYTYTGNGTVVGKFPWDAKSDLVLDKDGQYTMTFTVHIDDDEGGDSDTDEDYGSYRVEGTRLILEPVKKDGDGGDLVLDIRGNRLEPAIPWPARLALKGFKIPDPVFVKAD